MPSVMISDASHGDDQRLTTNDSLKVRRCRKHSRDRRRRRDGGRDEVGAATLALATFEIAIAGGGAAFAGGELVGVHAEAHRETGGAPLEARVAEDAVNALGFGL